MTAAATSLGNLACSMEVINQPWTDYMHGRRSYTKRSRYFSFRNYTILCLRENQQLIWFSIAWTYIMCGSWHGWLIGYATSTTPPTRLSVAMENLLHMDGLSDSWSKVPSDDGVVLFYCQFISRNLLCLNKLLILSRWAFVLYINYKQLSTRTRSH